MPQNVIDGAASLATLGGAQSIALSNVQAVHMLNQGRTSLCGLAGHTIKNEAVVVPLHAERVPMPVSEELVKGIHKKHVLESDAFDLNSGTLVAYNNVQSGDAPESKKMPLQNGSAIWFAPLYQHDRRYNVSFGSSNVNTTSDMGGVTLGLDYTFDNMYRVGMALSTGAGYGSSDDNYATAYNTFRFWGLSAYAGMVLDNFSLTINASYLNNINDIEYDLTSLGMDSLETDATAESLGFSVLAEYLLPVDFVDIIPYVGVEFTSLTTQGYSVDSMAGGSIVDVEAYTQNIWTFPVGVKLSKNFALNDTWNFTPMVSVGAIFAAGDLDSVSRSTFLSFDYQRKITTQVVDAVSFDGGLGFSLSNDTMELTLKGSVQASEHSSNFGLNGAFTYYF